MRKNQNNQGRTAEKVMREAVKEAIEKQLKLGIPAVFMKNGRICYKMPDGSLVYEKK